MDPWSVRRANRRPADERRLNMRVVIVTGIATVLTLPGSAGTAFAAANPRCTGSGGQNYSPTSRYDVACFQVSSH